MGAAGEEITSLSQKGNGSLQHLAARASRIYQPEDGGGCQVQLSCKDRGLWRSSVYVGLKATPALWDKTRSF